MLLWRFGFELRCAPDGVDKPLETGVIDVAPLRVRACLYKNRLASGTPRRVEETVGFHSRGRALAQGTVLDLHGGNHARATSRGRRVAGILVGAVAITAIGLGLKFGYFGATRLGTTGSTSGAAAINQDSPLSVLNEGLRSGNLHALAFVQRRTTPQPDAPRLPLSDKDAATWVDTLSSLRASFPRLSTPGRATAVSVACRILDKFAVEPAPALWIESLKPIHDLLTASLCDREPLPRYTALVEVSRLWVWIPGRSLTPFEEQTLGEWKGAIHVPVVRCLAARDPETRIAAVACLVLYRSITRPCRLSPMSTIRSLTSGNRHCRHSRNATCC